MRSSIGIQTERPGSSLLGLSEHYRGIRSMTTRVCASLTAEDLMVQAIPEASPAKWHLAHTTWFFETFVLSPNVVGYGDFDPRFRKLFNSYYNAVGEQPARSLRSAFSRPTAAQVQEYRRHVDTAMGEILQQADEALAALVILGLNHEQQHQELIITDIKSAFWANPLHPAYCPKRSPRSTSKPAFRWHEFPGGVAWIGEEAPSPANGKAASWNGRFAFDNEGPRHQVYLQEFKLGSVLVTNGEYLEFLADGGYQRPEFWLSDGWLAVEANRWQTPLYWQFDDGKWLQMTCSGMEELHADEPVCHVSFYEADAYARWRGARLPTEMEWEVAASQVPLEGNFLEDGNFHPTAAPGGNSSHPLQLFGDVWEWTASPYVAYPGFRPSAGALGEYNAKFMCNQMVLRGGSCVTPRAHIRASYRNFFSPQTRWQFSGIRLASDAS